MKKIFVALLTLISGLTQAQAIDFNCIPPSEVTVNWILNGETTSETVTVVTGDNNIPIYYNLPNGYFADKKFNVVSSQPNVYYSKVNVSAEADATKIIGDLIIDKQSPGGYLGEINIDLTNNVYNDKFDFTLNALDGTEIVATASNTFYNSLVGEENAEVFYLDIPDGYALTMPLTEITTYVGQDSFQYRFLPVSYGSTYFRVELYVTGKEFGSINSFNLPVKDLISPIPPAQVATVTFNWFAGDSLLTSSTLELNSDEYKHNPYVSVDLALYDYEVYDLIQEDIIQNGLTLSFGGFAEGVSYGDTFLVPYFQVGSEFNYTDQVFNIYLDIGSDIKAAN